MQLYFISKFVPCRGTSNRESRRYIQYGVTAVVLVMMMMMMIGDGDDDDDDDDDDDW